MSRIYFHAPHRTAEVGGSERAYFGVMASDLALSYLRVAHARDQEWVRSITVDPDAYVAEALAKPAPDVMTDPEGYRKWALWVKTWETYLRVGDGKLRVAGEAIPFGELALNTLIAMNSPQMSFVAHVHGCCESHGYVEAENAGWLAEVIEKGRETNLFRADQGWEDVATLAREVASGMPGPIVMSYSVCEGFPNADVADWTAPTCEACGGDGKPNARMKYTDVAYDYCTTCGGGGAMHDDWYDLPEGERWELGVRGLLARDWPFAMGPDRHDQGFLTGKSVFDLLADRWTGQLASR